MKTQIENLIEYKFEKDIAEASQLDRFVSESGANLIKYMIIGNAAALAFGASLVFGKQLGDLVYAFFASCIFFAHGIQFGFLANYTFLEYCSDLANLKRASADIYFVEKKLLIAENHINSKKNSVQKQAFLSIKGHDGIFLSNDLEEKKPREAIEELILDMKRFKDEITTISEKAKKTVERLGKSKQVSKNLRLSASFGFFSFLALAAGVLNIYFCAGNSPLIGFEPKYLKPFSILN